MAALAGSDSCFPVSPAVQQPSDYLPPGLGLAQRSCADDDDFPRPTSVRLPYSNASALGLRGMGRSRDEVDAASSSAGWSSEGSGSSFGSVTGGTPLSSLANSLVSECSTNPTEALLAQRRAVGALEYGMRSLSMSSGLDDRQRRERAAKRGGWEDPALAAARRALWEDVPEDVAQETQQNDGAGAPQVFVDSEENASSENAEDANTEEWRLPVPAREPCHTTLTPRAPCLRNSPLSRASLSLSCSTTFVSTSSTSEDRNGRLSPSAASTASTSAPSVTFARDPPTTCPTYSKEAYERGGDAPVEKLSIKEWIELQGVREAVGLWSGKIGKWEECEEARSEGGVEVGGEGRRRRSSACEALAEKEGGVGACEIATGAKTPSQGGNQGRTPCPLAAVVGVVQVARSAPNSPIEPSLLLTSP
ncbi:proteophosphoglycan ppg4 [Rhodotorula toruloides]|uniref:Proteophosphoglycan ppg4 n=1 Tax=Rhodotorula toruloides TaxID=5286 RepID=A0A511K7I7_RHOTO|nr:proteophosphoglycan ppg4 [Rhodotorula toruloides]